MTRRLLVAFVSMALLILTMLTIPLGRSFADDERRALLSGVERDARVIAAEVDDAFENDELATLPPAIAAQYGRSSAGRAVLVDATGRCVGDSSDPAGIGRDFSTRPEIAQALRGTFNTGTRPSSTLGESLSYVVVPIRHEGSVLGAVRVSYPTAEVDARTRRKWIELIGLDALTLVIVAVGGWFVARTLGGPIVELERTADELASGDLDARVAASGPADLQRVARTFNSMADRLQSMVESQRSFLADASHQLRTPLTALRLRLEPIAESDELTPAMEQDLGAVLNEVDRLSELVEALLAMARLDARQSAVVDVALGAAAVERVAVWSPLADEQRVELVVDDRARGALVRATEGGVEQILDNLIANAIEHSPAGSTITVRIEREPSAAGAAATVALRVADEGPGLDEAQMAKAFDRYWRGPEPSEGGSGLGLAIVRGLAEAAGGSASMRRGDGGGLEVSVSLLAAH